ncbi:MAG: C2 family cysteine protease [bacterium]
MNATSACACDADRDGRIDNDADGDGLTDRAEYVDGVVVPGIGRVFPLAWDADTDRDGIPDGTEVNGYRIASGDLVHTDPTRYDTDGDGLSDQAEIVAGTDPSIADTDGDGLTDGAELRTYGTDPTVADQDGDGVMEWREIKNGTDPKVADTDGDGLLDGVDPNPLNPANDTDGDGLDDADERAAGLDPNHPDSDGDGLTDFEELRIYQTWPMNRCTSNVARDCDGDGLYDGFEVKTIGSSPKHADTDSDGDSDWVEWAWTGSSARVLTPTTTFVTNQPAHGGAGGLHFFGGTAFPPDDQPVGIPGVADPRGLRAIALTFVVQQQLGDCWFMAALMASIGSNPAHIRDLITPHGDGTYTVKLYRNGNAEPVYVRIDAQLPIAASGNPLYAGIRTTTIQRNINGHLVPFNVPVLFPALLEKAAARINGNSYGNLDGNVQAIATAWRGLELLTGSRIDWTWGAFDRNPIYTAYFARSAARSEPLTFSAFLPRADCRHQDGSPLVSQHVYAYTGRRDAAADTWEIWNPWNAWGSYDGHAGSYTKVGDLTPLRTAECFIGGSIATRNLRAPFVDRVPRP